jgi:hypothetical protein
MNTPQTWSDSSIHEKIRIMNAELEYNYLGDFSATPPWHSRSMSCDNCRVSWTGCWDNFQCPNCGMGDLPGFGEKPMTISELKAMLQESLPPIEL